MITIDTLRAAALSDQPWVELDKLVRAELAAGRLTRAIYDEIMSLQDAVSDTPGYTEDSNDAIGDTLDALIGFCRAECAYKNPPILPTEEEIEKLPHWARVAFAARCARRVLSLFEHSWPDAPETHTGTVVNDVEVAERAAGAAKAPSRGGDMDTVVAFLAARSAIAPASQAVAGAVRRAILAAEVDPVVDIDNNAEETAECAEEAAKAADSAPVHANIRPIIRRDFDHLSRLSEWQHWTDDTPVPPEVFGPLWPEGPPKGWPPITDVPARAELSLELFARERATEQMIEDDVVNLFNALNEYHIKRSGIRLTLADFHILVSALVPAEA